MSYGLFKLSAFMGIAVASGGITVSSLIFSVSKDESTTYKTSSYRSSKENLELPNFNTQVEKRNEPSTVAKKCVIFETDEATGSGSTRNITKILKRYDNLNQFLKDITDNRHNKFKNDVSEACSRKNLNDHQGDITVYVYKKSDGLWNYTQFLQKKDWSKDPEIRKNSPGVNLD
nr:hypothetical protein [Mycoplasma haemocanis]